MARGGYHLKGQEFDVVIVDEASQALEAQCWVPLMWARTGKLVLAGDDMQLPPTIKSGNSKTAKVARKSKDGEDGREEAVQGMNGASLQLTLFDRLLALHGPEIKCMLTRQYRMHETIMRFPSDELYESKLTAAELVKKRLLKDVDAYQVQDTDDTREALVFWDTQGGDFAEKAEDDGVASTRTRTSGSGKSKGMKRSVGESKCNEAEAALVKMHVGNLISAGVQAEDIAVITPYNAQVRGGCMT